MEMSPGAVVFVPRESATTDEEAQIGELAVGIAEQLIQTFTLETCAASTCIHNVRLDADCVLCDLMETQESDRVPFNTEVRINRETIDKIARKVIQHIYHVRATSRMN
jgi:hypothetical protein